jgi:hypothetical protein
MWKQLFNDSHGHGVGLLAAGNLMLNPIQSVLSNLAPWVHLLLVISQVAVAVLTAVYIWRKIRAMDHKPKRKRK